MHGYFFGQKKPAITSGVLIQALGAEGGCELLAASARGDRTGNGTQ